MENDRTFMLVAISCIVALLILVVVFRNRFKTKTKRGPVEFDLDADPSPPAKPGAKLKAGKVSDGAVILNEGAGGSAEVELGDISGSKVVNTAGEIKNK